MVQYESKRNIKKNKTFQNSCGPERTWQLPPLLRAPTAFICLLTDTLLSSDHKQQMVFCHSTDLSLHKSQLLPWRCLNPVLGKKWMDPLLQQAVPCKWVSSICSTHIFLCIWPSLFTINEYFVNIIYHCCNFCDLFPVTLIAETASNQSSITMQIHPIGYWCLSFQTRNT